MPQIALQRTHLHFLFHHLCLWECRRKDLKQAVHRLRNQLQIHQTKKATTIGVLKASELEIKVMGLFQQRTKSLLCASVLCTLGFNFSPPKLVSIKVSL